MRRVWYDRFVSHPMRGESEKRLPLLRLGAYLVLFGACGAVAAHELYYALAGNTTTATVLAVGTTSVGSRSARYWAEYEYFDAQQVRHVARAQNVHGATRPGDRIEVQYLRHAPETSRIARSPAGWVCFGSVALLAAVVFVAEIIVRRLPQKRAAGGCEG